MINFIDQLYCEATCIKYKEKSGGESIQIIVQI